MARSLMKTHNGAARIRQPLNNKTPAPATVANRSHAFEILPGKHAAPVSFNFAMFLHGRDLESACFPGVAWKACGFK